MANIGTCWICGEDNLELTSEHKFKVTDLKRASENRPNELLFIGPDKDFTSINGFNDSTFKFEKNICQPCNGIKTQKHDEAYEAFNKYIFNNYEQIFESQQIDFKKVFGSNWKGKKRDLYKYYAKHAGCKVETGDKPYYIDDIRNFIYNDVNPQTFTLKFELNELGFILRKFEKDEGLDHLLYNGKTFYDPILIDFYSFDGLHVNGILNTYWVVSPIISEENQIDWECQSLEMPIKFLPEKIPQEVKSNYVDLLKWYNEDERQIEATKHWIRINTVG